MQGTEEELMRQARVRGLSEGEVLRAWKEMRIKHHLPMYVEATLVARPDGMIVLLPAVNINLLDRVEREVPGFDRISGPIWPAKG